MATPKKKLRIKLGAKSPKIILRAKAPKIKKKKLKNIVSRRPGKATLIVPIWQKRKPEFLPALMQ